MRKATAGSRSFSGRRARLDAVDAGHGEDLGVRDSFAAEQNVAGGTAYLDALLMYYHEDIALLWPLTMPARQPWIAITASHPMQRRVAMWNV